MSFYWQNAVPQESGQSTGSTWDNINLGGSPAQQNQTIQPAQQSFSYENQQNAAGYEQYVNPYADQWAAYHAQQAALAQQQQKYAQEQQQVAAHPPQIEHQPILAQPIQPPVESSVPTTDHITQESQSNHTTYDGWGHEGWSSHEPSVEPQVQPTVDAHQYYQQQQQYYQEQIPQQPASIEQNWAPSEPAEASSTSATIVESAPPSTVEIPPMEIPLDDHPIVKEETPQPSPIPVHLPPQPSAPSAVLDLGFYDEIEENEEKKEDVEMNHQSHHELAHENGGGWGEEWGEEEKEEEKVEEERESIHLSAPSDAHPRTSTPSPVEEQHEPEPTVSPIEVAKKESAPSPSPSPSPIPPPLVSTFPSPPTILAPSEIIAPPPSIDTKSSPIPPPLDRLHTENTQKTSPPASTDSWVEVSSSGSDAVQLSNRQRGAIGKDGVPPLASSSPARPEKRSSVSSVNGVIENGLDRRRDDSDSTHDGKRNVRDSFRDVKTKYLSIFNRLEGHRSSGREGNKTPTRVNPLLAAASNGNVRLGVAPIGTKNSSTPKEFHQDSTYPPPLLNDLSVIEPRMYGQMDQSVNMSMESRGYGEDMVNDLRKDRHRMRTSRPASRAKSEYGDPLLLPDRGERRSVYDHSHMMHPQYGYHPSGRYSLGRHSSMGMPYPMDQYDNSRRSMSTYDHAAHLRMMKSGRGAEYDAFDFVSSGEESEEEELPNESDNEMRRINHSVVAAHSRSSIQLRRGGRPMQPIERLGEEEISYLGFVNMDLRRAKGLLHDFPPPIEFWTHLEPMEKVGFLYYTSLHRKNYPLATKFKDVFQSRFLHFKLSRRLPPLEAMKEVCYEMRDAYTAKMASNRRAYEDSQRQLFSDEYDRGTPESRKVSPHPEWDEISNGNVSWIRPILRSRSAPRFTRKGISWMNGRGRAEDGEESSTPPSISNALPSILKRIKGKLKRFSDRPSVYDHNQTSDIEDVSSNSFPREPLKFRLPHAFATFGPGGKIIQVQPSKSIGTVHMTDIHCIVRDREMQRNVALANNFKGPLFPNQTPPHVVRAYITRQIDRIRRSDLAQTDPRNDDIIDCLLIWQLLEKVVQQHGRVTGPDMAELLTRASASHRRDKREGGGTTTLEIAPPTPDPKAYETFCQYLLQGLIDDAINFAMGEGLYSDALSLARRLVPHRVDEIEKRHFTTRPPSHPVLTLMAVASQEAAPCLSSMASEDRGGWRCHAAILFANLSNSPFAMETIRRLGEELARRDCNAAADFCFLSVALLAGLDTFTPCTHDPNTGLPLSVRRHIELIHASIPDDIAESTVCDYGFSLTDLHATEMFDYGSRLSGGATNLAISAPYQRRRIQYAKLLASWGGFALDSFRYCTEVARTMWEKMSLFTARELEELAELAERLHKVAAADEASTLWIESLNQMIPSIKTVMYAPAFECQQQQSNASVSVPPQTAPTIQEEVREEEKRERLRSESISTEAAAWHSRMGDEPLEMRGGERNEEERRECETHNYAAYHDQQQQQQQQQYTAETVRSDSHHSTFHQEESDNALHAQSSHSHHSHPSHHSHHSHHDGYSSGTTTERGGMSSEESTPIRERSSSIHSHSSHHSHPSHPNPLAPSLPSVTHPTHPTLPSAPLRAPAPIPPMPALSAIPPSNGPSSIGMSVHQQQPPQQPQLMRHDTASSTTNLPGQSKKTSNAGGGGGGVLGWMGTKLRTVAGKAAGNKEMILPDDSKKEIYYDEKLGQWVGAGVEQETAPPPPPSIPGSMNGLSGLDGGGGVPQMMMGGGLRAARNSGGSRYFNPLNDASTSNGPSGGGGGGMGGPPMGMPPPPTGPTQFIPSFIPTMPDDAVTDSPFSERAVLPEGSEGYQENTQQ